MTSFTTDCPSCEKKFKTLYSLKKHVRQRHEGIDEDSLIPYFKDQDGKELQPAHASSLRTDKAGYSTWLAGITERVNSTFHPRLPGGWVKIDSHQVPKQYFDYFITKLGVQVNAVRKVCHRGQPYYQSATLKVSYKLFRLEQLVSALEEQPLVSLQRQLLFEGNEICSNQGDLSAEDEIARAKARVHTPAGKKKRRPSSKSLLQVGLGEGRATREVEIIWWPNVYTVTEHGQMIIRMYIQKCDF